MGNNEAYSAIESITIHLYNTDKLDLAALDVICDEWRGCDVDSGGSHDRKTKDGLCLEEVIVKVANPKWWERHAAARPNPKSDENEWDKWYDAYSDQFYKITRKRWDWW